MHRHRVLVLVAVAFDDARTATVTAACAPPYQYISSALFPTLTTRATCSQIFTSLFSLHSLVGRPCPLACWIGQYRTNTRIPQLCPVVLGQLDIAKLAVVLHTVNCNCRLFASFCSALCRQFFLVLPLVVLITLLLEHIFSLQAHQLSHNCPLEPWQ